MNLELEQLIVLQAQDLEMLRLRSEWAAAPRQVKSAEEAELTAQKLLAACKQQMAAEEKLRRSQESESGALRTRLQRLQQSLDTATNAQQVSAFQHDIAFAQAAVEKLENEEYTSLERTESLEVEQALRTRAVASAITELNGVRESATALRARHALAIADLERERTLLRTRIASHNLSAYDKLTKTRGTAVAEAVGSATSGKCSACQMGVRPQRWQDLIGHEHLDEIFHCETCGRLLFWDTRQDKPGAWPAGDRLRAAQAAAKQPATATSGGSR